MRATPNMRGRRHGVLPALVLCTAALLLAWLSTPSAAAAAAPAALAAPAAAAAAQPPAGLFLRSAESTIADGNLAEVCAFYGLQSADVSVASDGQLGAAASSASRLHVRFIAVSGPTLARFAGAKALAALRSAEASGVKIVVYDVGAASGTRFLGALGAAGVTTSSLPRMSSATVVSTSAPEFTREFTGLSIDSAPAPGVGFVGLPTNATTLARARGNQGSALPIAARIPVGAGETILLSAPARVPVAGGALPRFYGPDHFADVVLLMAAVRYAAGDRAWHATANLANFTIDDPRLVEPYGPLDFDALLSHARSVPFHATIAFIPYNAPRSDPAVVSLFRANPESLSLAVHGDNHDLGEFDPGESQAQVEHDLVQALGRMQAFSGQTGVTYSRVMVFPRHLGSMASVEALARLPYLATVNATQIPTDATVAPSRFSGMQPAELAYAGFPLVGRRYVPPGDAPLMSAFDLFVGRPATLYGHADYFSAGPAAFDATAVWLNGRAGVRWATLDEIARSLYLVRAGPGGSTDVEWFGQQLTLRNPSNVSAVFHIVRPSVDHTSLADVTVDGKPADYSFVGGAASLDVTLGAGQTRAIALVPAGPVASPSLGAVAATRESIEVPVVRYLSGARDTWLGSTRPGRIILAWHDALGTAGSIAMALLAVVVIAAAAFGLIMALRIGPPSQPRLPRARPTRES